MGGLARPHLLSSMYERSRLPADEQVRQWRALPGANLPRVSFVLFVRERNLHHPELSEGRPLSGGLLRNEKLCWFTRYLQNGVQLAVDSSAARMIAWHRALGPWLIQNWKDKVST